VTESLKGRETEVDRSKDGETHWNKQAIGLQEEKKKRRTFSLTSNLNRLKIHRKLFARSSECSTQSPSDKDIIVLWSTNIHCLLHGAI
jgi:hypothetical protein